MKNNSNVTAESLRILKKPQNIGKGEVFSRAKTFLEDIGFDEGVAEKTANEFAKDYSSVSLEDISNKERKN